MRPRGLALFLVAVSVVLALRPSPLRAKVLSVTLVAEPYAGINSLVSVHADLDAIPDVVTIRLYRLLDDGGRQLAQELRVPNWTGEGPRSSATTGRGQEARDLDPSPYGITMETVLFLPLGKYLATAEAPGSPMIDSRDPFDTTRFLRVLVSRRRATRLPAAFSANARSTYHEGPGFADGIVGTIHPSAVEVSTRPVLRWRYEPRAPAEAYVYVFDESGTMIWQGRTKGTSICFDGSALKRRPSLYWIVGAV